MTENGPIEPGHSQHEHPAVGTETGQQNCRKRAGLTLISLIRRKSRHSCHSVAVVTIIMNTWACPGRNNGTFPALLVYSVGDEFSDWWRTSAQTCASHRIAAPQDGTRAARLHPFSYQNRPVTHHRPIHLPHPPILR